MQGFYDSRTQYSWSTEGQGNEGKGHDAWAGFPYEQLNKARSTRALLTANGFEIEGEGAGVCDSSLGLKQYLRRITMKTTGKMRVGMMW